MHGQRRAGALPPLQRIAVLHQPHQVEKAVGGKDEPAQRIVVVPLQDRLVRAYPCAGKPFILKALVVPGEGHFRQQRRPAMPSPENAAQPRQGRSCALCRIVRRTSAHKQPVNRGVMALGVRAHHHGAHTVPQQRERQTRVLLPRPVAHHLDVFDHGPPATFAEIPEVPGRTDRSAVPAVVVDHGHVALRGQIFHEIKIAFLVLAHPVDQLENTLWASLGLDERDSQGYAVGAGFEFQFLHISQN